MITIIIVVVFVALVVNLVATTLRIIGVSLWKAIRVCQDKKSQDQCSSNVVPIAMGRRPRKPKN